ncbi:MAG: hypothetical protein ABIN13_06630 [Mucilaginibacter sp.]
MQKREKAVQNRSKQWLKMEMIDYSFLIFLKTKSSMIKTITFSKPTHKKIPAGITPTGIFHY